MTLGTGLLAALQSIAAELTTAGLHTSLERAQVRTPGAWLSPQTLDVTTLGGGGTARAHLYLITSPGDDVPVLRELGRLLDLALTNVWVVPAVPVDMSFAVSLPHSSTPLPAFRLTLDLDL